MRGGASSVTTLVTGAAGFAGSRLVPLLQERGDRVVGVLKPGTEGNASGVEWVVANLADPGRAQALVAAVRPQRIVHLAALAVPGDAARSPLEALRANYLAVDALLEGMATSAPGARLLFASSGAVYGLRSPRAPAFREEDPLAPPNAYAATKAAAEARLRLAVERDGLDVVCARPFNHSGPGRPPDYAESSFARQLVELERRDGDPVLRVGNLEAIRDFCDVRDVARAYRLLLERGERGAVYNVCSGEPRTMRSILDFLLARARVRPRVEVDPARYRPSEPDAQALVGDPARIRALGWTPEHPLDETLAQLLEWWRAA